MLTSIARRFALGTLLGCALGSSAAYAQLAVEPSALSAAVPQGETATRTVTLTNTGSETLAFCLSFDRPLQRAEGSARLSDRALGSACGDYGEVLALVTDEIIPDQGSWDPYGATMTPDGRLFVADYSDARGRTHELTPELAFARSFDHPIVRDLESNPVTTGVAYNADTGTLWWLNIEGQGFPVFRALLLEGDLDGVATGRRIELPVAETAPPPYETGRPVGLAYDVATKHYYYTDIANSNVWAVNTLGTVVNGYPVQPVAYPGATLFWGINTLLDSTGSDAVEPEGLRLELLHQPARPVAASPPRCARPLWRGYGTGGSRAIRNAAAGAAGGNE
jgi:hypothetical protein